MVIYLAMTSLPSHADAQALGAAMEERLDPVPVGVGVITLEDGSGIWEVSGYFDEQPDIAGLELLAALYGARPFAISELPQKDWVAEVKRELHPIEAGRFFLYGSHDADKLPDGRVGLLIDAAMAFGTGHHGTTLGCLLALEHISNEAPAVRVADIGCGTAVLAMAAKKLWPKAQVIASDIDQVAVDTARANLAANDLADDDREQVGLVCCAGLEDAALKGPFDLIFANILMGPLIALAEDMAAASAPGGRIILSGILEEQAARVDAAYEAAGFALEKTFAQGEWRTLLMRLG